MRKSILACSVSLLMSPLATWALGMGDIQVNSSLNQPLNAEITLHSVTRKDLDSLRVALAPRSIYSRADIERSDYLKQFRFKVIQRGGKSYVTITTKKAFREPFANFLIEATWGSGRLLREYTMLLDPPEFIKKQTRPVVTATTAPASQVKRTATRTSQNRTVRETTVPPSYAYSRGTSSSNAGNLEYGPTERNDTLWNIAKKMAPANISVDQMMMALLRDNPEAFIGNNINNLKAGYVLRIKDPDSLDKLSRSNANRQVREQYQSWKHPRQQKPAANIVDRSDRTQDKAPVDGQLKLVASGDADNAEVQGNISSQARQLKEKLSVAGEELESKEVENQELRARIKELEELLKTKSSLVELKDESLAALQKQKQMQAMGQTDTEETASAQTDTAAESEITSSETNDQTATAEQTETAEAAADKPDTTEDSTAMTAETEAETNAAAVSDTAAAESETPAEENIAAETETAPVETDTAVAEAKSEELKPVVETKPVEPEPIAKKTPAKPEPAAQPEEEIIDTLLSEEMLPYTAGGAGLLVLLLGWLGLRGRGKKENEFEESILDSKMEIDDSEFAADNSELTKAADSSEASTEVLASDTETSFLSDFSADDMESLQPDDTEADPMSEADVFMVYGRYQQAEELLQNAIKSEPERIDYQLKLLEVYHGDNLKDSFAVQADVVKDLLKKNNDDYELTSEWTKAKSWAEKLGLNIDMPDSFDEEPEAAATAEESLDDTLDDFNDLSLESEEISFNEDSILGDASDDFDLSLDETDNTLAESTDELSLVDIDDDAADNKIDSLSDDDFELNLDEFSEQDNTDTSSLDESTLELDENSLELNEDSLELDENSLELNEDSLELDENSLELNEDSLELDENSLELNEDSLELDENSLELDENSLELNEDSLELDENSLEFNEDSLELDENSLELNEDSLELNEDSLELNEDSLELSDKPELEPGDLDEQDELELLGDDLEFDELDDDFPELDAVGTKLDLAKAYIDMGDMESASSILNEVIDEGDDDQKAQAQSLLDQTDS